MVGGTAVVELSATTTVVLVVGLTASEVVVGSGCSVVATAGSTGSLVVMQAESKETATQSGKKDRIRRYLVSMRLADELGDDSLHSRCRDNAGPKVTLPGLYLPVRSTRPSFWADAPQGSPVGAAGGLSVCRRSVEPPCQLYRAKYIPCRVSSSSAAGLAVAARST